MTFSDWKAIDAAMDILIHNTWDWQMSGPPQDRGPLDSEQHRKVAQSVRQAGWDQVADGQAENAQVQVTLTREQWAFIGAEYRYGLPDAMEMDEERARQGQSSLHIAQHHHAVISLTTAATS